MIGEHCTEKCAAMPECTTCRKSKKPVGRDAGIASNGYCDSDCPGCWQDPSAGHLWPLEWADHVAAKADTQAEVSRG